MTKTCGQMRGKRGRKRERERERERGKGDYSRPALHWPIHRRRRS